MSAPSRYVTAEDLPNPAERYRVYRLCACETCNGIGKLNARHAAERRCGDCRGEGRVREHVASCDSPEALGVALVTLGREGEWVDCPIGILDTMGKEGEKWIVKPWLPSARNLTDAGRALGKQSARKRKTNQRGE